MRIVEEEAEESTYWMELLVESGLTQRDEIDDLLQEADEIVAITVSSIKTARSRKKSR
jgi:four helix bundle protein